MKAPDNIKVSKMDKNKVQVPQVGSGMKRRAFLGTGLLSITGTLLLPNNVFASSGSKYFSGGIHAYLVESGQITDKGIQCVGLLKIDNSTDTFARKIRAARNATNFKPVLSYNSTNRYKVEFAKMVIDAFIAEPKASLCIKVFHKSALHSGISNYDYHKFKFQEGYLRLAIENGVNLASVEVKQEASWSLNNHLQDDYNADVGASFRMVPTLVKSNDFLQVASFLVGSVYADQCSYDEQKQSNAVKADLLRYLKDQMGVPRLDYHNLAHNHKIQIVK